MKRGTFIINGVDSDSIKTYIQDRPLIEAPLRKTSWKSAYGVEGEIPFDEGSYEDTSMELILVINGDDVIESRQKLVDLLDGRGSFVEMVPYFDPDKIYRVMVSNAIKFENKFYYGNAQAASLTFKVRPYKYLLKDDTVVTTSKTIKMTNPTNYTSQPLIKLKGTGAVKLIFNDKEFNIRELPNDIVISSEHYVAYREGLGGILTSANDKITSVEYPLLKPGSNDISIEGNVTEVTIDPRWRSLV